MSSAFAASGPDMDELEDDLEMGQQARRGADRDQYLKVIQVLKRDIADLERQLNELQSTPPVGAADAIPADDSEEMQTVISFLLQANAKTVQQQQTGSKRKKDDDDDNDPDILQNAHLPVANLSEQVHSLALFSGIEFFEASNKLVALEGIERSRKYALSGTCYGIFFRVVFDVLESTLAVTSLNILVSPESRSELESFVFRCHRDKALLVFFRGFVRYARLRNHRMRTFERIYAQFPTLVSFPHSIKLSTCMFIERKNEDLPPPAIQLVFLWEMRTTADGQVHPHLELLPRASRAVQGHDTSKLLARLPSQFLKLVEIQGVTRGLEAIIRSLLMEA